jgi:protein MpaA
MSKYNGYPVEGDIGYPTPGSLGTYYGKERDIPVITLETWYDTGEKAWQENAPGLKAVISAYGE